MLINNKFHLTTFGNIFLLILPLRILVLATAQNDQQLSLPVAFPIFRPPLEEVHRHKTSAENIRPLRFHSIPSKSSSSSNLTTEVEEISAPSDSFSSPEEEEEEEDTSSQHHHGGAEEEFIFSSVPTLMVQLNKEKNNGSSHTGESKEDAAAQIMNAGNGKTKEPMKMNKSAKLAIQQQPFMSTTMASINSFATSARRLNPPAAPPVSIINTPQFPVFTGMGMEIIDSHESTVDTGSITSTTTASGKDDQLDERHKMHYHRTDANGNSTANGTKDASNPQNVPVQMVHLSTLATGTTTTTSSKTPKSHIETSSRPISSSGRPIFTTTIHTTLRPIEGTTRMPIPTQMNQKAGPMTTEGQFTTKGSIAEFRTEPFTKAPNILLTTTTQRLISDEVTEDLLAILNSKGNNFFSSSKSPLPASAESNDQNAPINPFHNVGLNGKDELDNGFERITQIAAGGELAIPIITTKSPRVGEEEILTRPTKPPPPHQGINSITLTPNPPINGSFTKEFTQFPLFWTSATSKSPKSSNPTTATPPTVGIDNIATGEKWTPNVTEEPAITAPTFWPRISPSIKISASTTGRPMSNHLEEEDEEELSSNHANGTPPEGPNVDQQIVEKPEDEQRHSNGNFGTGENIGHESAAGNDNDKAAISSSKFAPHPAHANARMFIMAGIILILLIAIVIGSACTAKYVKKSRQLHGKYRPAAYEMQTQQRYHQPTDYVHQHHQHQNQQHLPQHLPIQHQHQQHQTALFNDKDERLI